MTTTLSSQHRSAIVTAILSVVSAAGLLVRTGRSRAGCASDRTATRSAPCAAVRRTASLLHHKQKGAGLRRAHFHPERSSSHCGGRDTGDPSYLGSFTSSISSHSGCVHSRYGMSESDLPWCLSGMSNSCSWLVAGSPSLVAISAISPGPGATISISSARDGSVGYTPGFPGSPITPARTARGRGDSRGAGVGVAVSRVTEHATARREHRCGVARAVGLCGAVLSRRARYAAEMSNIYYRRPGLGDWLKSSGHQRPSGEPACFEHRGANSRFLRHQGRRCRSPTPWSARAPSATECD